MPRPIRRGFKPQKNKTNFKKSELVKRGFELRHKNHYCIFEVAVCLANKISITPECAKKRIYRAIENGKVISTRHLGSQRLSREQALNILKGEDLLS